MMRDPRAIFVSEIRRRRTTDATGLYRVLRFVPVLLTAFVLFETTVIWAEGALRASRYRRAHPGRYRMVRFEDLVGHPGRELRELCAWLGLDFQPAMLDQRVVSVGAKLGEQGIDEGAASRWRGAIPGWADRWFRVVLGQRLRALGYEPPDR
jgi:hypothetical protein